MRKTSVYLFFIILYWFVMMQALLFAQSSPHFEHSQSMHQYILREAYKLLQRESPGMAVRLKTRIGEPDPGTGPWDRHTIMAGAWREDAEDIIYGHGGPNKALQPGFDLNRPGSCMEVVYDVLTDSFKVDARTQEGFISVTHFWDPDASNRTLIKRGIHMTADWPFNCLDTQDQWLYITPAANAWEKFQMFMRPQGQLAIRDRWWAAGDLMFDATGAVVLILPPHADEKEEVRIRYNTLVELYNTGVCTIELPGSTIAVPVVLTQLQRNRYVWEILGRVCHLLGDMSVPAHTHKDMHMGNIHISEMNYRIVLRVDIEDDDSYETWMASGANAWWTADQIQEGLIPLSGVNDPLHFLMSSMRSLAAAFASDDFDGTGAYVAQPRYISDIPSLHNLPAGMTAQKLGMMMNIRDNTLPYAIRATATLLHWFASQLSMPEDYSVWTMGATGYFDFFARENFTRAFPVNGTMTGTRYHKQAGDELSFRSHVEPHPQTSAKFRYWTDNKRETVMHQWDDYVIEEQSDVECWYASSEVATTPQLRMLDELAIPLGNPYPLFKNPWHVDPSLTTDRNMVQLDRFDLYKPTPAPDANGGIFVNIYDVNKPPKDYYSIRASELLDGITIQHKPDQLIVGDYSFLEWEPVLASMYDDPKNSASPPIPAYANPGQYDTKIVDFMDRTAEVSALYKKHRTSDRVLTPTNVNSQRKVAQDAGENYHAVYESSSRIWYVKSTDRGVSWSREERVSDKTQEAVRPAIAANATGAWIAFVADGAVHLRIRWGTEWKTIYSAPVTLKNECTPSIAVLDDYEGAAGRGRVICLVWEEQLELRFAIVCGLQVLVDNEVLAYGRGAPGSIAQPRFPSVAASTMTPSAQAADHGFHIAWLENGSVYYVNLAVDRNQSPVAIRGWKPGGAQYIETVHARSGTLGIAYPARHAPSIAVTQRGTVHVAYDVDNWYSPWPNIAVVPPSPTNPTGARLNGMFAIRERGLMSSTGPTWNTTATLVGGSSKGNGLCSPSVGARPDVGTKGTKSTSLRIPYNDVRGQLNVVRLDGGMNVLYHAEGWDPSMTAWSRSNDGLVDVYSTLAAQPYSWHVLASQNNLAKTSSRDLLRMRQMLLGSGESLVSCGLAQPRLRSGDDARDIAWNEAHDSLVIGVNTTLQEKMRTEVFTPRSGEKLLVDIERFGINAEDAQAEILLRVNDAKSGEALRVISMPVDAFASAAAMAVQELDLSSIAGTAVFMSADVHGADESWSSTVVDRYALAEEDTDGTMEKPMAVVQGLRPELKPNHPNPFNPSTTIQYILPEAGPARLAVYNLLGEEVAVLQDGRQSAGIHELHFDGAALPSGVYIYRLQAAGVTQTRSMHLVK